MSTPTQTLRADLAGGGFVELTVEVDWLTAPEDDCRWVRAIARSILDYNAADALAAQELADLVVEAPTKARQVPCPDCGQLFPNRHAVDSHRRDEHPRSAARPAARKPRAERKPPGRQPSVDYEAVAAVMRDARAAGQPMKRALAEHCKQPETTVKKWITKVNTLGLLDRLPENTTPLEWDLPKRGDSIDHEADTVYRCADCGEERATVDGINEHAYQQHQRPARITERTAVRPQAAA